MEDMVSEVGTIRGTVRTPSFAPKGEIDAVMIEADGGLIQVNIPSELSDHAKSLIGREITVHTRPEPKLAAHPKADHPVFRLAALVDANGKETAFGPHGHKPHDDDEHGEPVAVSGTVQRLNYAKHGEANGVVPDIGDFVHRKPDGMKKLGLKVGQQVTAPGKRRASAVGGNALDAEMVNGVELGPRKPR